MNNETNKDAEAFERWLLNWLLPEEVSESTERGEEENFDPSIDTNNLSMELDLDSIDPLELEDDEFLRDYNEQLAGEERPMLVENRVQTLLKKRLKTEIEQKLPMFPWEEEIQDYQTDYPDLEFTKWVPPAHTWTAHKQNLRWGRLSIPTTENVFAQLLDSCQNLLLSQMQDGAKMVMAVDGLFPGQSKLLNDMSNQVLLGARRDNLDPSLIPSNYEDANSYQQMLLSLLAAKDIINSLTIPCKANEPTAPRHWETALGTITLQAEYRASETGSDSCLRIKATMPAAGKLQLKGNEKVVGQQRTEKGVLEVQLLNPQPGQTYELNVGFNDCFVKPLRFAVLIEQN
ncbi:MAG: hypothetical protein SXA11_18920 [Cyanobacteriota bacterium]|nr:hypothetical protein [Cyanobacteriota bacterium]